MNALLLNERLNCRFISCLIRRRADHLHLLGTPAFLKPDEDWHLLPAWHAPRRPEVDDDHLPTKLRQVVLVLLQILEG